MLGIEEIRRALQDRVLTAVAAGSGVNRNTIAAIRDGENTNPHKATQKALSEYLCPPCRPKQ